jgi:two-component system OmpR family sensor kinase
MRRRLTISILLLVAATLVVTTVGSFFFIRRASVTTGQQELAVQAKAISTTVSKGADITRRRFDRELRVIANAGAFAGLTVVKLYPNGAIVGPLPSGITERQVDIETLTSGKQVTGHTISLLVYSAVPTPVSGVSGYVPVLVITRQIHNPISGLRYFLVVGAIALCIAALVAAALARRVTRPLLAAVSTTSRIASGDLDATVPVDRGEDPEFAQLAASINAMGTNLVRARDQERQFILSVSHELRTPLTSIRGYAEATIIGSEARRLERLVQDLLDLARIDADRFSLDLQRIDADAVLHQVADGVRPHLDELGLELVVAEGHPAPLWALADSDRLAQVAANLVANASSFAEHRIEVGTSESDRRGHLWVADDGPGIATDQLAQVFQRHFISDRVSGRRTGSGLGLAIVAELSAAMGMEVRAESPIAMGRGTRMVVSFDLAAPPDPPGTES